MPPLYNAYGAKTLRSKFCKDKQNWTFNLDPLKIGLIWNSIFTVIWFQPRTWLSWEPDLGAPINSVFLFFFFLSFSSSSSSSSSWNLLWRLPLNKAKILYAVRLTWDPIRRSPLTRTKVCMVGLTWDPVRRSPLTRTNILCVVGLTWDPVRRSPLTRTNILRGWANLRSRPSIPFNQNQNLHGWANLRSRPAIPFNQNHYPAWLG